MSETIDPRFAAPCHSDNPETGSEHSRTDGEAKPEAPIPTGPASAKAVAKNERAIRQVADRQGVADVGLEAENAALRAELTTYRKWRAVLESSEFADLTRSDRGYLIAIHSGITEYTTQTLDEAIAAAAEVLGVGE